ncbi:MAG TPA: hypothetical protein ENI61_05355 [Ignavibacteria bacterium]|nr:hypothetical protein [Ignavibacteria bacterium]
MAQVGYTNLFSEPRNEVVSLLTSSNVPDPVISSSEFRKWIYSRIPDIKSNNFQGYPFLIVSPTDVDFETGETSGDGKHKFVNFNIDIEIRASDRGYDGKSGNGLIHIDTISNNLIKTFSNIINRNSLANNSLELINSETSNVETLNDKNELIYRRVITISFRSRLAISQ